MGDLTSLEQHLVTSQELMTVKGKVGKYTFSSLNWGVGHSRILHTQEALLKHFIGTKQCFLIILVDCKHCVTSMSHLIVYLDGYN